MTLDESCTVTVGNQTALVRPDGSFRVRNISIFESRDTGIAPQLYRVRATCLRDGEMITGQSEFAFLTAGETAIIADVFPSALDPIPAEITVSAPGVFVVTGATLQLTVVATLPDGSTEDVTTRASGTTYLSTNSSLLTVSEDGLVTGVSADPNRRSTIIAVLNEGNLATIDLTAVGPSNDLDNDGMPNDYEELFGLNPLLDDANGDLDGDGLTNFEEFERGTLPNNPDTDGDGVRDDIDGDPLRPEESPPTVRILSPVAADTLIEGQSLTVEAEAMDDGLLTGVEFRVNGASLGDDPEPPFELTFMVPLEASALTFEARASDGVGNVGTAETTVLVTDDPLTSVVGRVVDLAETPVEGADVALELLGLRGEFFDFGIPLITFPDLTGLTPDATALVSSLNLRNPDNLLSPDTFGLGFSPDFAARFTGRLKLAGPGLYTIILGADDGARLTIPGAPPVTVVTQGLYNEVQRVVELPGGEVPIEVEYFQRTGDAELKLALVAPGETDARVPVEALAFEPGPFVDVSAVDGTFGFDFVPTNLGALRAKASKGEGANRVAGRSELVEPVPGGVTDLGDVPIDLALYITADLPFSPFTTVLYEVDPTNAELTPIGDLGGADSSNLPLPGTFRFADGIDFAPDGTLYAVAKDSSLQPRSTLVTLDLQTADPTPVGPTGVEDIPNIPKPTNIRELALRPPDTLFAQLFGHLATIDLATGAATYVAPICDTLRCGRIGPGLAAAPGGVLWTADRQRLYRLNPSTGAAAARAVLNWPEEWQSTSVYEMEFHPHTGVLWAIVSRRTPEQGRADLLATIDVPTGNVEVIGELPTLLNFGSLAWGPAR